MSIINFFFLLNTYIKLEKNHFTSIFIVLQIKQNNKNDKDDDEGKEIRY